MLGQLEAFAAELRFSGVGVSTHEMLVASESLRHIDLSRRSEVKAALGAIMCRTPADLNVFSSVFDLFFSSTSETAEAEATAEVEELAEMVAAALRSGDEQEARRLGRALIEAMSGEASGGFLLYRTLRALDLDSILQRVAADDDLDSNVEALRTQSRISRLKRFLEQDVRARMVAENGASDVARRVLRGPLTERDFATITADESAEVRRAVMALARRLSSRLSRLRSKGTRGRLDVRATMRESLSTGGVPVDPRFKRRSPSRPDLVLLCDVSGSVAAFTRFTLLLVAALQVQFPRIRSFLFVDTVDEVTDVLKARDPSESIPEALRTADVVWLDGHSDYGYALKKFHERYLDAVSDRTHVIVLGDARTNYRESHAWVLKEIASRAKRLWWLNPEAQRYWDTGDSAIGEYAEFCHAVVECRNLKQLGRFVEQLG